jgi:hypothetical protein
MSSVGLLFVGSVLFMNGLLFLGKADVKGVAVSILSLTTCTIPGFLLLLGDWGKVPTWAVVASIVATAVAVALIAIRTVPAHSQTSTGERPAGRAPELRIDEGRTPKGGRGRNARRARGSDTSLLSCPESPFSRLAAAR